MTPGLGTQIARWALQATGAIPPEVRDKTRVHVADSVAIAHAASVQAVGRDITSITARTDGAGPAHVLGSTDRLSPVGAAFANSALIHALDFDDVHDLARLHPTAVALPAALAAADLAGNADRRPVEQAVAVGNELMCRLGTAIAPAGTGPAADWFLTQLLGYVGAAVAAGLVMDLDEPALVSAIGLATMQAAGAKEAGFGVGSTARAIYPAFAASGGLRSAVLAAGGLVGPPRGLDGDAGLFHLYLGGPLDPVQAEQLVDPLRRWDFMETQLKRWPCCRLSHPYVAATLQARSDLDPELVTRIVVRADPAAARLCRPLGARTRPQTLTDAKYSIPFLVAFTLVHGAPDLDNLTDAALDDQHVLRVARSVEVVETGTDSAGEPEAYIAFASDGHEVVGTSSGTPPMSSSEVRRKQRACRGVR